MVELLNSIKDIDIICNIPYNNTVRSQNCEIRDCHP